MKLEFAQEINYFGAFILQHKHFKKSFLNYTKADVVNVLLRHLRRGTLLASITDNRVDGILLFTPNVAEEFVEVNHILANKGSFIMAIGMQVWGTQFPGCQILATRRGKPRWYQLDKMPSVEHLVNINHK